MAYDIPSISDLEAIHLLNKHYAEVVTSKKDGIASGSDITQTTNPITGVTRRTLYKILDDMDDTFLERLLKMAFTPVGTFTAGATLTDARQTLLWEVSKGGDGHHYSWSGSFGTSGKVVTAGSSPSPIEAGSWVDRTDDSLRDEIRETVFQNIKRLAKEAGYNLVDGSFQTGAVTVNQNDVVWDWSSGKYYGGVIGSVSAGSTPATSGGVGVGAWVDRTNLTFRSEISDIDGAGLIGSMSYAQLRAYSGPHTTVNVWGISNVFDGAAGQFRVNASDTTSADNGGTILVDASGRRWYRNFVGRIFVQWFGAKGDWDGSTGTDDSQAFQSAINYAYSLGGGEVYAPPVKFGYYLNSQIWVKSGVTLSGATHQQRPNFYITAFSGYYGGNTLVIGWGSGSNGTPNSSTASAVRLSTNGVIKGFKFIYPTQITTALSSSMTAFPPSISAYDYDCNDINVEDCWFVNAYRPIYFQFAHGPIHIKRCGGFPGKTAITLHGGIAGDVIEDPLFGAFWFLGNMPGAGYTNMSGIQAWCQFNSIGIDIGHNDAFVIINPIISNMYAPFRFGNCKGEGSSVSLPQLPYGCIIGGFSEGGTYPFLVGNGLSNGISSNGVRVSDMGITCEPRFNAARGVCVEINQPTNDMSDSSGNRCRLVFDNCEFWGAGSWNANTGSLDGVVESTGGDVEFNVCTFKRFELFFARILSGTPNIKFSSCQFDDYSSLTPRLYHFAAQPGAAGTIIHQGCTFRVSPLVYYGSGATTFITNYSIPVLASAATLPVPLYGDSIFVTGTTNITNIDSTYAYNGRRITLQFQSTPTVVSGGNLKLTSNFVATGDDMLMLEYRSGYWWEISRSVLP